MFFLQLAFLSLLYSQHWLTGVLLGLAAATKWTGLYYMIAFGAFMMYADFRRRQTQARVSESRFNVDAWARDCGYRFLQYLVIPVAVYLASWSGWFFTKTGWERNWANLRSSHFSFVPAVFRSWIHYQAEVLDFHRHLTTPHPYSANPWSWLVMGRPTAFLYQSPTGCGAAKCSQEILALGTPVLWWSACIAIFVTFGYWIARREWQSGLLLLAVSAGYLPWFLFQKRTMFSFYAIAFEPFLILVLVYTFSKLLQSATSARGVMVRQVAIGVFVGVVALNFLYFLPLYTGASIPYSAWHARIWLPSWF
jgi:dolichyl-phosphate-mannose--protein O-mannosyl transferase